MNISTFVFFDIETTGLPYQEKNQTKITELSFVAVSSRDIESTAYGTLPLVNKLSLLFNPQRKINAKAGQISGLSNTSLAFQPLFKDKIRTINAFLEDLPKPVCLVAHNGNRFDFKMIVTEYKDANAMVPASLLCIDSLIGFRKILKDDIDGKNFSGDVWRHETSGKIIKPVYTSSPNSTVDDIMTDDEDDWPELNASAEDWKEIDELTLSLTNLSCSSNSKTEAQKEENKKKHAGDKKNLPKNILNNEKIKYTLSDLYRRLLKKEPVNAHRAEVDCILLLECVIATKSSFLRWANSSVKPLVNIEPFNRNSS